jgi:type VI protein secretion system component VasF
MCAGLPRFRHPRQQRKSFVNRIVWLVGAVVIILFVLGFLGLR